MAQGDVHVFDRAKERIGDAELDLGGGSFYCGLITSAQAPAESDTNPLWLAGTPAYTQATPQTGNYATGGQNISSVITDNWTRSGATCTFDADNASWAQHVDNPTSTSFGLVYLNDVNDYCLLYVELGSAFDMRTGDLTITWNGSGLFTLA